MRETLSTEEYQKILQERSKIKKQAAEEIKEKQSVDEVAECSFAPKTNGKGSKLRVMDKPDQTPTSESKSGTSGEYQSSNHFDML